MLLEQKPGHTEGTLPAQLRAWHCPAGARGECQQFVDDFVSSPCVSSDGIGARL